MSSGTRGAYSPPIPQGVQVIAWMTLLGSALVVLVVIALAHTVEYGAVLFTEPITGRPYVASGWVSVLEAVLIITAVCALCALAAVYTLKGRMWGYYVILANLAWSVVGPLLRALTGRSHFSSHIIGILMLVVFLRGFTGFREFSKYQARTSNDTERS